MLGAPDDLLLQLRTQVIEVVAITYYPHNQVLVFLRMFLCIPEGVGPHHIKLDMMPVHANI